MSRKLEAQLEEDRALRDAAREVFYTELAHARSEATPEAIGQRIANRIGARADEASNAAIEFADRHGTTMLSGLAAAATAAGLWLARKPILSGLARMTGKRNEKTGEYGAVNSGEDSDHE
ncbi:hypothetical protein SZ64_05980 [Erythrobacter sp. SG61-1L]|uniref:hypothetical protein n=1 Tax=Erythrobacter sp. SG61-1L TaxID=1603897 RepID=UPI0006C90BE3|nr:hypothetical protein [Erythrobacter sp. SG61-1L]KPL67703.1 hypothetical protein SZ64_05980 [Erythrobacter sp. SG61-1L]